MSLDLSPLVDARIGSPVGRLQWSKNGITIYNPDGGFIARMEHPADCVLMNNLIRDALRLVSEQQVRRKQPKVIEEKAS